ncbi:MAG: hypothetical protein ABJZ55_02930 [Fuerstiella sp.]
MDHTWTPKISLGPIRFNEHIGTILTDFSFLPRKYKEDHTGWSTFGCDNNETLVHLENEIVQSVACHRRCILDSTNLIGLTVKSFLKATCSSLPEKLDQLQVGDQRQDVYEFDNLGAQVWLQCEQIVTIICDAGADEDTAIQHF